MNALYEVMKKSFTNSCHSGTLGQLVKMMGDNVKTEKERKLEFRRKLDFTQQLIKI